MTADAPIVAHDPVRRILWARGLRDFGDGLAAVLLPAYLVALGYGAAEVGVVARMVALPSCEALELGDGSLIPLVRDCVRSVDIAAKRIDIDRRFLGAA